MPTYDYECGACGKVLEIFQTISEAPKRKCPSCGKSRLKRLIGGGAGFIFKGSGFYITDYRSESYKAAAKAESEAGSKAKDSGGSGGEATSPKPEGSKQASAKPEGSKSEPKGGGATAGTSSS